MGNSAMVRLMKKTPRAKYNPLVRGAISLDKSLGKAIGAGPITLPDIPTPPPPEQIDEDAYRIRDRARRRARSVSNVRTSATGAAYTPAPKSLLGS